MKLNDTKLRKIVAAEKDIKLADGAGLYLLVKPSGSKLWRQKYRFAGKEKVLSHGPYPEVSLAKARELRDNARKVLREGGDPGLVKKRDALSLRLRAADNFETIAREWFEMNKGRWTPVHAADVIRSLERDVFASLGNTPITEIDAPMVLDTLRQVERRGSIETAKRIRQRLSAVFVFAISQGRGKDDPAAIVGGALKPLPRKGRQPALTALADLQGLMRAVDAAEASPVTKLASRLLALTAVRPAVVRGAVWPEFENIDWEASPDASPDALWRVPSERMKLLTDKKGDTTFEHVVPLPWQAVDVLQQIRRLTEFCPMVFPGHRSTSKGLSENAIGYLYNRAGYHGIHVPHGWRAAFSTIMNERRPEDRSLIDMMLAHSSKDKVEAAYNRSKHMEKRRELASEWADLLMDGLPPASVILQGQRR